MISLCCGKNDQTARFVLAKLGGVSYLFLASRAAQKTARPWV